MTSKLEQEYKACLEAVEKGDESAKTKLAWYKLSGVGGCEIDTNGAVALLEERVKAEDAEAMWMLSVCCEFGRGCEQDIPRAETLREQSHKRGNEVGRILVENGGYNERGTGYLKVERLPSLGYYHRFYCYGDCCGAKNVDGVCKLLSVAPWITLDLNG